MRRAQVYAGIAVAFGALALALYLAAPKFNVNDNTTRDLHMYGAVASLVAAAGFAAGAWKNRVI